LKCYGDADDLEIKPEDLDARQESPFGLDRGAASELS
jgi:hypothetical protein